MLEAAKKLHAKISALHLERAAYVYVSGLPPVRRTL